MKKILAILAILCIAITFIGIASAEEVTIADVKFNITDGYNETASNSQNLTDGLQMDSKMYMKGNETISINVMTLSGDVVDVSPNFNDGENKTINNKTGLYSPSTKTFHYQDGDKIIEIQDTTEKFEDIII